MIDIRNIQHTSLDFFALKKLLEKYIKSLHLKNNISLVFDKRLTGPTGAYHYYFKRNKSHVIRVWPEDKCSGSDAEVYVLISYILHELKHAEQVEKHGYRRYARGKGFAFNPKIKDKTWSAYYSQCEIEARVYENKNLQEAVEFYNKQLLKEDKHESKM